MTQGDIGHRCAPNVTRAPLMSASKAQKRIPSPDKAIEWCHVDRVEVRVRLLELVRGRAIDNPSSELGHSEELLREWREACRLVEQSRLRIRVAFEEVDRLLVGPDVALKLQRTRLLLCRGHKLWYQRLELVHLIDGNGEHPVHLFAPHPCLHGTVPQATHDDDNFRNCPMRIGP